MSETTELLRQLVAIDSINPAAALIWATLWLFWQLMTLLAAWRPGGSG